MHVGGVSARGQDTISYNKALYSPGRRSNEFKVINKLFPAV